MDWYYYILLALLPAIAAFGGGIVMAAAKVAQEHIEDHELLKKLFERLADKEDPLTPEEFMKMMADLKREFGESKQAWIELWGKIRELVKAAKK